MTHDEEQLHRNTQRRRQTDRQTDKQTDVVWIVKSSRCLLHEVETKCCFGASWIGVDDWFFTRWCKMQLGKTVPPQKLKIPRSIDRKNTTKTLTDQRLTENWTIQTVKVPTALGGRSMRPHCLATTVQSTWAKTFWVLDTNGIWSSVWQNFRVNSSNCSWSASDLGRWIPGYFWQFTYSHAGAYTGREIIILHGKTGEWIARSADHKVRRNVAAT